MKPSILDKAIRRAAALLLALLFVLPVLRAQACPLLAAGGTIAAQDLDLLEPLPAEEYGEVAFTLEELAAASAEDPDSIPTFWPIRIQESGLITSYFGNRTDPVTGESTEFHAGIDLADKLNTKIYAAGSGVVTEVEYSGGYGLSILIDHGNGYVTRYSHLNSSLVEVGDEITQGQLIATMGASGRVTGVHLDFRVYLDEKAVDPLSVLESLSC